VGHKRSQSLLPQDSSSDCFRLLHKSSSGDNKHLHGKRLPRRSSEGPSFFTFGTPTHSGTTSGARTTRSAVKPKRKSDIGKFICVYSGFFGSLNIPCDVRARFGASRDGGPSSTG
jgi:hypothetical protein